LRHGTSLFWGKLFSIFTVVVSVTHPRKASEKAAKKTAIINAVTFLISDPSILFYLTASQKKLSEDSYISSSIIASAAFILKLSKVAVMSDLAVIEVLFDIKF